MFRQFSASHNIQVWRTPAEEFDESCLVPTVGQSPGFMFWACFLWHGLGLIVSIYNKVNGEVYVKLIRRHVLRAIRRLVPNSQGIFQQDNATPHKYWKVKAAFSWAGIPILPWPAQSADLNLIENMWQEVERRLQNSPDKSTSIDDLEKKVIAAWYSILHKFYCGLVNSVVHRVRECYRVK
ncbi:6229_t:CDS:1, partial [Cetraspora pellucida]